MMGLIAKSESGIEFKKLEDGVYTAVSSMLIDLGIQNNEKFGKKQRKIIIVWQIIGETIEIDGEEKPRIISKEYKFVVFHSFQQDGACRRMSLGRDSCYYHGGGLVRIVGNSIIQPLFKLLKRIVIDGALCQFAFDILFSDLRYFSFHIFYFVVVFGGCKSDLYYFCVG